jgi:hypothetical protein
VVTDERIARRRNERGEACAELEPRHHHEMRGRVRHAPAGAARAHRSTFGRERDELIVPARIAVRADEAVREDATAQVRAQLLFT